MKKIFFSLVMLAVSYCSLAQAKTKTSKEERREKRKDRITALVKQEEEGVIVNPKHFLGGVKLTTDGYGGFIEVGRAKSTRTALLFQLDITERKHPKRNQAI